MKTSATKNYIYNTAYKVLTMLTPLITAPFLARVIGSENVGIYSYTYAFAYNFSLVAKLGLINYGSRSIAKARDNEALLYSTFSEIYFLQVITSVIATVAYYVFVVTCTSNYRSIFLIQGLYVLAIAIDIDWLFYGLESFKSLSLRNIFVKIVTVIAILVFVKKENGLWTYVVILVLSDILRFVSIWIGFRKNARFVKPDIRSIFKHLKPSFILFIPVIATSIYRSMDKIMLGSLSTMTENGLYEYSEKIIYMLLGFVTSLEVIMMPRISNMLTKGNEEEALRNIEHSMTFIVALTSGMAFGISGISERFIPLFYGEEFIGCIRLMPPLAITLIFIGWANVIRTQYIMPKGRDIIYVISTVIGAIVNFIINFILIPRMQAMGAVVGTIAAELSAAVFLTVIVRKELPVKRYFKNCFVFPLIGAVMCAAVYLLGTVIGNVYLSLVVQIVTGIAVFLVLSGLYIRFFQKDLYHMLTHKLDGIKRRVFK